jgi:segregation and condensation protein B
VSKTREKDCPDPVGSTELHPESTELHSESLEEGESTVTDLEATVNLTGNKGALEELPPPREGEPQSPDGGVSRKHLKGLLEALVFVSDRPVKAGELARSASAPVKIIRELLSELRTEYESRGIVLAEIAGGYLFRSSALYAPFVRDVAMRKPVRLTRAQTETLAILAYRQPITRPEVDDIRGVDSGPILKLLLERDLVRILGRKDEPGRPVLYGTTSTFLEFFGLKSLKELPTLREFTDLNEDSRRVVERELGDVLDGSQPSPRVSSPEEEATDTSLEAAPVSGAEEAGEDPRADDETGSE